MARGADPVSSVTTREERTEELLARLADCAESEREAITAEIVELNLGLCDALANRYANRGADREDLVQVARLALLLAIRRYRHSEGRPFVAFAVPTISGELKRHFRDHCWMVRPPRRIQELRAVVSRNRERLEQSLGRTATTEDLVAEMGVDEALLRESQQADGSFRPWSLDAPFDADADNTLGNSLTDGEDNIERLTDVLALRRALSGLSRRDRLVVKWRFEEGCTQGEIGRRLGISQMQVSRIIRRILGQARAVLTEPEPLAG
jgi:RNA polymerase sigma-B factor